jgi:hypothetical protein
MFKKMNQISNSEIIIEQMNEEDNCEEINTKFNPIGSKYELRFNKLTKIEFITNYNNKIRKEKINITAIGDIINKKKVIKLIY